MSQPKFNPKQFNQYREDNRLEAKAANGGLPGTLWDTYSSFANSYGGCIVCGAVERKDGSWKTTGLKDLEKIKKQFWDTIHNKKKVSLCLLKETDVDEFLIGDDVVLVIRVGANIRYYRKLRGYSQEKLAEMADFNDKLVGFYETGKRIPPVINLVAIAEALDVTVDELCGVNTLEPGAECHRNGPAGS